MSTTRIPAATMTPTALVVSVQHSGTRSVQEMLRKQGHIVQRCHVDQDPERCIPEFEEVHVPIRDPAAVLASTNKRAKRDCLTDVLGRWKKLVKLLDEYGDKMVLHRTEDLPFMEGVYGERPSKPTTDPLALEELQPYRERFGYGDSPPDQQSE